MTPEGKVKAAVKRVLDRYKDNTYYFFVPQNGYGRAGVPDIVGCCCGVFFAIECKAGKGTTTALQDKELTAINAAGGISMIVREDNISNVEEMLSRCTWGATR